MNDNTIELEDESPLEHLTLEGFRFFKGLPPEVAQELNAAVHWVRYAQGEMVFDFESDGLEVYFVVHGKIKLLTGIDGDEPITLAEVTEGEVFGELAAVDQLPRSARAVAARDSILGSIEGPQFLALMEKNPKMATKMLKRLASIIRSMDVRLTNLSLLTPKQRIIAELMRRAEPDQRVPGMWIIPFAPTHGDIASWAGLERDKVAPMIGELARDALLRRRGGSLVLLDWACLQAMVKPKDDRRNRDNGDRKLC